MEWRIENRQELKQQRGFDPSLMANQSGNWNSQTLNFVNIGRENPYNFTTFVLALRRL